MSVIKTMGSGNHTLYDTEARAKLNEIFTATEDNIGQALVVESVTDGVASFTFGDAGGSLGTIENSRLNMSTAVRTDSSPQLVDKDAYTFEQVNESVHRYRNVIIDFSQNGKYYNNPLGYCKPAVIQMYDANDTLLTYNSGASNNFETDYLAVMERVNDTTVTVYKYLSEENFKIGIVYSKATMTFSGTISYAKIGNLYTKGTSADYGITFDRASNVYIPYGYDLTYNEEMVEGVFDGFVDNHKFAEIPEGMLSPWMQREHATTDNLLDNRKIDWNPDSSRYLHLKAGETIPVEGGRTIMCNKGLDAVKWIDSEGNVTVLGNKGRNLPIELPATAVAITFQRVWASNMPNGYEPVYMYYVDTLYPYDDVERNPVPMAQMHGYEISNDLYDQCIPEENSEVVRMMKTFAIREINHRQDALRVGTFNVYVNRTDTNRQTVRKELETYGIDICCFQEAKNSDGTNVLNIGDYLKRGWQFNYCNTNAALVDPTKGQAMVSAYEILSSEEIAYTENPNSAYLKCVIQLPKYKDIVDSETTLSIYNYHGNHQSDGTLRIAEATQIIEAIASDTSDFVIVCGDTNDFSTNKDIWAMFANAGLTPVHDGTSSTVTDPADGKSLDQIFIGANITFLHYDVISSYEWMYTPSGSSTSVPVSDHDLVFADLQFDFAAAIEARNQGGT